MFEGAGSRRLIIAAILLAAFLLLHSVGHDESTIPHKSLHHLAYRMAKWTGKELPLEQQVLQAVGASDYTNRVYLEPGDPSIQLYIGYYASQRTGDTIHTPKNCLPGSGWDPIRSGYATIPIPDGRRIVVNEYMIQKDQEKQLVFYWYQGRGRVIASEYLSKLWTMADAISRNRTDGALVRLNTPIIDGESRARARLLDFTQIVFPRVDELIPK